MRNDKYCYPNSDVLVNKANIKDKRILDEYEQDKFTINSIRLYLKPNLIDFNIDVKSIKLIHHYLFSSLYAWAGSFRDEDIMKQERVLDGESVFYAHYENIEKELNFAIREFKSHKDIGTAEISKFLSKIWIIHPFREGNTRTCIFYLWFVLKEKGIRFDFNLLMHNPRYVRDALVMTDVGIFKYIDRILNDAINQIDEDLDDADEFATHEQYKITKQEYEEFKAKYLLKKTNH